MIERRGQGTYESIEIIDEEGLETGEYFRFVNDEEHVYWLYVNENKWYYGGTGIERLEKVWVRLNDLYNTRITHGVKE